MPSFSASGRTTNAPTATLPGFSLYAIATSAPAITEIEVCNTTAVACEIALVRLSSAGTSTAFTAVPVNHPEQTASSTPRQSHTGTAPTLPTTGLIRQWTLGAAVGSGVIWTWPDNMALTIAAGTTNGIGLICPTGTGQICSFSIQWIE